MNADLLNMHNRLTTEELDRLVRHQVNLIMEHPEQSHTLPPIMIWGAPGIGKSSIIKSIAKELCIDFIDVRLAQREPVDIRGLPVPGKDSVHWLISDDWPRDSKSKGIILFDELTAADRSLQVAAYEFILDRKLGSLYQVSGRMVYLRSGKPGGRISQFAMDNGLFCVGKCFCLSNA